jgi:hypothetical protein
MALDQSHCLRAFARIFAPSIAATLALLLSVPACAQAASVPATVAAPQDIAGNDDDDISIRIPPQPECLARMANWSEPEKWAWQQICARERVDFDKRYNKETTKDDLDSLKSDPSRRLGASFFRELFENPQLSTFTQNAAVNITGAYIPTVQLTDTSIGSLLLFKSRVDGDFTIESSTILRSVRISASSVGDVDISRTRGGDINIANSKLDSFSGTLLSVGRLSLVNSSAARFRLTISRLNQQLAFLGGSFGSIMLDDIKSDGLFIRPTAATSVSINDYVDSGMFFLEAKRWLDESELKISTMATGRFFWRGKSVPAKVSITASSFQGADWGPDPLPYLKANSPYNPALYANLATSYSDAGQPDSANAILVEKQNAEYRIASSFLDKTYLFTIWLLADYGYRPEIGLLWIVGFVLVSALIFKTGASRISQGNPPGSWLVFAFDSAIPGIQLNKEHADIQFLGWRQGFLYLLRFLSAVVVVLVLEMMKKSFGGL